MIHPARFRFRVRLKWTRSKVRFLGNSPFHSYASSPVCNVAMSHTQGGTARVAQGKSSIRTQSKPDPFATKPVFRSTLDNPLNLAWSVLRFLSPSLGTHPAAQANFERSCTETHSRRSSRISLLDGRRGAIDRGLAITGPCEEKGQDSWSWEGEGDRWRGE